MGKHEITDITIEDIPCMQLQNLETGAIYAVSPYGLSLERLQFPFEDIGLRDVVYGHADWAEHRRNVGLAEEGETALSLLQEKGTGAGGTLIFPANRVHGGKIKVVGPNGEVYGNYDVGTNHEASGSLLHGNTPKSFFDFEINEAYGFVKGSIPLSETLSGFPAGVHAFVHHSFSIHGQGFRRGYSITNNSDNNIPIALGNHDSFRIGDSIEDMVLETAADGVLETDDQNNPTGRVIPIDEHPLFRDGYRGYRTIVPLRELSLDNTFTFPNHEFPEVKVYNPSEGYGVSISVSPAQGMITVWTNDPASFPANDRRKFIAVEPLTAHGATLSLPAERALRDIDPRLAQVLLPRGKAMHYEFLIKPYLIAS
ncbi:hypothetical protein J4460_05685 [Candidatus Woesearchaeota archaeon]|nr:MAG: hypothetical protein QS99_C0016G0040 [archaeon GW2011_AR4]MBS3130138.1 hypothetical protein [Candidatus Woesearchaeota archaeon]HIH38969.1 hypothetical protein [Candidatus Woesearchaeota archaeon]HIH48996.1 hypothetical protein [Candidatus Woesearchaeota archaeon]HIJ04113.1 hypothetical protein [Candidatus Woesearchaeota archaeon]